MNRVADDLAADGWTCIRLDVEGVRTEEEFLRSLCREIEEQQPLKERVQAHFIQRFKQLISPTADREFSLNGAIGPIDHRLFLETLIAALDSEEHNTLILIDEIALFVLNIARTDRNAIQDLLYLIRKLMQRHRQVRWFLTGSVGLDVVARQYDMAGAMLGYDTMTLDAFSAEEAKSFVDELFSTELSGRRFSFSSGAFEYLVAELGWLSPYHLRQTVLNIQPTGMSATNSSLVATPEDIDLAFRKLLSPAQRLHFAAWEEHIAKNFDAVESKRLDAILCALCMHADGETSDTLFTIVNRSDPNCTAAQIRDLLHVLASDGYIHKKSDRWMYISGLLRRFWHEYKVQ